MFEKKGFFSLIQDLFPKDEGSDSPFETPSDGDDNQEGIFEGCLAKIMSCGPIGCMLFATGGVGAYFLLFGG